MLYSRELKIFNSCLDHSFVVALHALSSGAVDTKSSLPYILFCEFA